MLTARAIATSFREVLRPWHVPTFSVVFADVDGNIGYQATGRIPIRGEWERGYRPGWDPSHQWQGLIPFDEMPGRVEPAARIRRDGQQSGRRE